MDMHNKIMFFLVLTTKPSCCILTLMFYYIDGECNQIMKMYFQLNAKKTKCKILLDKLSHKTFFSNAFFIIPHFL